MDYEKAYKAVLQTATQWIKDGCTDKEKICLECVFPELRESEDERIRKAICHVLNNADYGIIDQTDYTVSEMEAYLEKQKEQKPVEWSEEDEKMRLEAIRVLVSGCERYRKESGCLPGWHKVISWLKSLRPVSKESLQSHWKPSEEQMKALKEVAYSIVGTGTQTDVYLVQLYEQLKKL